MDLAVHPRRHQQTRPRERPRPGRPLPPLPRSVPHRSADLLGYARRRQVPLARQHRARPPHRPRQRPRRRQPLHLHLRLCRPLLSGARPALDRSQRRAPSRRLRRHRLDQGGQAHLRSRRRVHPLALPQPAPHHRRQRRAASARRPPQGHRPLDRPAAPRHRYRAKHHPRHPGRSRRHAPRGRALSPRRRAAPNCVKGIDALTSIRCNRELTTYNIERFTTGNL